MTGSWDRNGLGPKWFGTEMMGPKRWDQNGGTDMVGPKRHFLVLTCKICRKMEITFNASGSVSNVSKYSFHMSSKKLMMARK